MIKTKRDKFFHFVPDAGMLCMLWICAAIFCFGINRDVWSNADFLDDVYACFSGVAKAIHDEGICLWFPSVWGGMPAAGNTILMPFYPVNYLVLRLCYDPVREVLPFWSVGLLLFFHTALLQTGIYALLRIFTKSRPSAAIAAGAAMFSMYFERTIWYYLFAGFAWLPLILLAAYVFLAKDGPRAWRAVAAGALCLGMSGLANQAQALLMIVLTFGIFYLCFVWESRGNIRRLGTLTLRSLAFGVLGMGMCAVAVLPEVQYIGQIARYVPGEGFYGPSEKFSLDAFVEHTGDGISPLFQQDGWIFFLASLLFFIGIFAKRKREKAESVFAVFCAVMLGFTTLYALGVIFPRLFYYIPFYSSIREPYLYISYGIAGFAYFVMCGAQFILEGIGSGDTIRERARQIRFPLGLALCLGITVIGFALQSTALWNKIVSAVLIAVLVLIAAVRSTQLSSVRRRAAGVLLVLLFAVEFGAYCQRYHGIQELPYNSSEPSQTAYSVKQSVESFTQGEPVRILDYGGQCMSSNVVAAFGGQTLVGYFNPTLASAAVQHEMDLLRRSEIRNVGYWTTPAESELSEFMSALGLECLGTYRTWTGWSQSSESEMLVWKVPTNGLSWLVYDVIDVEDGLDDETTLQYLNDTSVDFSQTAYRTEQEHELPFEVEGGSGGTTETIHFGYNSFSVHTDSESAALLVTSEAYYPGWHVYVDGQRQNLENVNFGQMGVVLGPGEHTVEFRFEPPLVMIGAAVSGASLLCIAALLAVSQFRIRRKTQ